MYEACQGTEYAVPGSVPVLCQWEPRPVWVGDSQNDHRRCRYLGSFLSKLLYPVVKGADSNAVLAAPVSICHATDPAFIDKFQLFFFWNSGFSGVCHDVVLHNCSCCSKIV